MPDPTLTPTPISPPALNTAASLLSSESPGPLSPITRSGTFEHKTSGSVPPARPFIETDTPAINAAPVELDGVPTSPDELKRRGTGDRLAKRVSPGLGEEESIEAEFLGEGGQGVGRDLREVRIPCLLYYTALRSLRFL